MVRTHVFPKCVHVSTFVYMLCVPVYVCQRVCVCSFTRVCICVCVRVYMCVCNSTYLRVVNDSLFPSDSSRMIHTVTVECDIFRYCIEIVCILSGVRALNIYTSIPIPFFSLLLMVDTMDRYTITLTACN